MRCLKWPSPKMIILFRHSDFMLLTKRSAKGVMFGDFGDILIVVMPTAPNILENFSIKIGSLSWIRYRFPFRNPSNGSDKFLAICFTHFPSAWGIMPAILTFLVAYRDTEFAPDLEYRNLLQLNQELACKLIRTNVEIFSYCCLLSDR